MCPSGKDNLCGHRYDNQYGELPLGYDHKFVYSHFGYNLKATDMQAAIGCAQLDKLPSFVEQRRRNWRLLYEGLKDLQDTLILPEAAPQAHPSWFGFLITCKPGIKRSELVPYIESRNIQTRMLFAGNLVKHPCFDALRKSGQGYRIAGNLDTTDRIMNDTFWLGVYPGMTDAMIDKMISVIREKIQ
jgi:CDP-6-deoxy-D-xylo-4-hexulose-3-dehydrase